MAENRISYLNRNYDDFKSSLMEMTRKYYNHVFTNLDDASIGKWFIELVSDVGDTLNYNIDKAYQETTIDSANEPNSIINMARTYGCKLPGKKGAVVEVELSCILPLNTQGSTSTGNVSEADESYAPIVKRGTLFSTGLQTFELMEDVDFTQQFDSNGISNRTIYAVRNTNGIITGYQYRKLSVAISGHSKIYKKVIKNEDIKPYMEILLTDTDIMNVESIILKEGTDYTNSPLIEEFYGDEEHYTNSNGTVSIERYFEVENLAEQYRYGYEEEKDSYGRYNPKWEIADIAEITDDNGAVLESIPLRYVAKGKWKRLKNKFVTEFTNRWNLKIIFGKGIKNEYGDIPEGAREFTQYMMCRMQANDYMGVLPEPGKTMFVLYRVGGGAESNIPVNSLTNIIYKRVSIEGNCEDTQDAKKKTAVNNSITVTNPSPSYGGKDEPSMEEVKKLVKYNSSSQNRCVTLHDYYTKIMEIPPKYGCPFRCGVIEENNKIIVYVLGLDYLGNLMSLLSEQVASNIKTYLSKYKMINDFVEIRSGKIINLSFEVDVFIDKTYDKGEVTKRIIDKVYDYMDIRNHQLGEDVYLGDLEKEISLLDGVQNLISLKVKNNVGSENGYSDDEITQELLVADNCGDLLDDYNELDSNEREIDLNKSDKILYSEANSMFEIKYKNKDIVVNVKQR